MFAWMRVHNKGLGAGLIFLLLAGAFHWHSLAHPLTSVGSMTDELLLSWTLDWNARFFAHPKGSLFDTPFFAPYPRTLAYTEHVAGLSLIAWPVMFFSDTPLLSYNLLIILSTWLTGWCVWLLARSLGAGFVGAVIAGTIASVSPARLMHAPGHVNILSQWWIPWGLFFLHRYMKTLDVRALFWLAVCVVAQGMTSPQGLMLMLVALATIGGTLWFQDRDHRNALRHASLTVIIALAAVSPFLIPYARTMTDPMVLRPPSLRMLHAPSLSELILPQWVFPVKDFERQVSPGLMPLLLLMGGLTWYCAARIRNAVTRIPVMRSYIVLITVGSLLALGPAMMLVRDGQSVPGLYAAGEYLPGFGSIRAVGRFSLLTLLGIAVTVGLLWDFLVAWMRPWTNAVQAIVGMLLIAEFSVTAPV